MSLIENKIVITFKFTRKNKEKGIIENIESGNYKFQTKEKTTLMIDIIKLYNITYINYIYSCDVNLEQDILEISDSILCSQKLKRYEPIKLKINKIELNKELTLKLPSKTLLTMICEVKSNIILNQIYKKKVNLYQNLKPKENFSIDNSSLSKERTPKKRNSFLNSNSKNILTSHSNVNIMTYLQKDIDNKLKIPNLKDSEIEKELDSMEINNSYEIMNGSETDFPTNYETFIECIFISGLDNNNLSLIEKSNEYPSICGHEECSLLPSLNPEILYSYCKENSNIELNPLLPKMNFPLGIKLCFFNQEIFNDNKDIGKYDTFMNVITNEKGDTFYMVSSFYYKNISLDEYNKLYKINPLKNFIKFEDEIDENGNEKNHNNFNKNLDIITKLMNSDSILIPYSISVVSKYQYKSQMEKCLEEILNLHLNNKNQEIDSLINHIINEIPIPSKNQTITFYLPSSPLPIELISPKNSKLKYLYDIDLSRIFQYFDIDNIVFIFYLIIIEQKLLFIHNNYSELAEISFSFINLIYPLNWINTYIPVLSFSTVKFLQSFIPYIMGLDKYLLNYSFENQYIDSSLNIAIIDIKNNCFCYFDSKGKLKKRSRKDILKIFKLPEIPSKINDYFEKKLKEVKKTISKNSFDKFKINELIKNIFLKGMILIIGEYNHHLFFSHDETPIFDSQSFLNTISKKEKNFYSEIISTQLFNQFLYNEKLINKNIENKTEFKENDIIDTTYFKKVLNQYHKNMIENISPKKQKNSIPIRTYSLKKRNSMSKLRDFSGNKQKSRDNSFQTSTLSMENNNYSESSKSNNLRILQKKNSLASINTIEINNKRGNKNILIYPYFIKETINKLDKFKISKCIIDNNKKDQIIYSDITKPLIMKNDIKIDNIPKKHKVYINHKRVKSTIPLPLSFPKTEKRSSNIISMFHNQDLTRIISHEEIVNNINNWFTDISTSEKKDAFKIIDIKIYLKHRKYRRILSKLLYQGSILDDENNKMLSNYHFEEMLDIIKFCLNIIKEEEFSTCKLFTLSLFSYYKKENDKNIFLYEEYINPKRKIKPCKLWFKTNYWVKWYEEDINQKVSDIENDLNLSDNNDSSDEKIKLDLLDRLESVMKELKLDNDLIKIVIVNELAHKYLCNESFIEFQQNFV